VTGPILTGPILTGPILTGPRLLTSPAPDVRETTEIGRFLNWLAAERGLEFTGWDELWTWSRTELEAFWGSIWEFFDVRSHPSEGAAPYECVLADRAMPGASWFPGARLNYAEHCLRGPNSGDAAALAIIGYSQTREPVRLTYGELRAEVARVSAGLRALGVRAGDRVVGYLPNIAETVIAFLATASLGAIWASCAPEFGARSVIDRFAQVTPTVLFAIAGYRYGDRDIDRRAEVAEIRAGLPTVQHVVAISYGEHTLADVVRWDDLESEDLTFEAVPFAHPLCVLFSSGTTGKPKAIVHCHGGILLEHLKNHAFSWDLKSGDVMLWFSTTAWMMWNALVSGLLSGACIVTVDGNPLYPDLGYQWQLANETGATLMGASPGFLMACRKQGLTPAMDFDLSRIRQLGAAGSPLPAQGYEWVLEQFGPDVLLNVGSGGTDVCSGIVQGSPLQPVWAGVISGACLGVDAKAFNAQGEVVIGELGELVITSPMPSMPVGFWGDADGSKYRAAYFEQFPGVWRHGDWIAFEGNGSCTIAGRSDATLNRGGVRLGTAEFYRAVEELPEITDSLVVHLEDPDGGNGELILFVVPAEGFTLDDKLKALLRTTLRTSLSPRHLPDAIVAVASIPRNRTGKKLELPVKKILLGADLDEVASRDSLADPGSLEVFIDYARAR
jgi:acetoacetyl-CoA synthetase